MITTNCKRYGPAADKCFWIVCKSEQDCFRELADYAKKHPDQCILYDNCGTKPGKGIPTAECIFEVFTPDYFDRFGMILWNKYQLGNVKETF